MGTSQEECITYIAALCPVCSYGSVGFWRCSDGETIVLICDECDCIWTDSQRIESTTTLTAAEEKALISGTPSLTGGKAGPATKFDLEKKGWLTHVMSENYVLAGDEPVERQKPEPPHERFTETTYKDWLARYELAKKGFRECPGEASTVLAELEALSQEYLTHLPVYLLACCPLCGGSVREPIDTFSLNGYGWSLGGLKHGDGWWQGRKNMEADCRHAKILSVMVNLNGLPPADVLQEVWIGSERPFVMSPVLRIARTYAVIHALPISRFFGREPELNYTAYFVSYFTAVPSAFNKAMQPAYEEYGRVLYNWADYDLEKWVKAGKLLWLETTSKGLVLSREPAEKFPYGQIRGGEGIWVIRNGQMVNIYGRNRDWYGGIG